jgi:hypothetical protein
MAGHPRALAPELGCLAGNQTTVPLGVVPPLEHLAMSALVAIFN